MRCFSLFLLLFFSTLLFVRAQSPRQPALSDEATVSVLTCAPGEELYALFGHSAIRVRDTRQDIDLAFNYGTFDFNTPFFYFKFAHGTLDYILSVSTFRQFMQEYFITGRGVWEQTLEMSASQKEVLFAALMENARPENRAYRYDFFLDNCATRVRDAALYPFQDQVVAPRETIHPLTFREAIAPYMAAKPWTKLGINLILGAPADEATDFWSLMFLPDHLMSGFSQLQVQNGQKPPRPLVSDTNQLLDFSGTRVSSSVFSPGVLLWLLFVIIFFISLGEFYGAMRAPWLNPILFVPVALAGLLIGYLTFISQHVATGYNLNFLWANPLWFLLVTDVNGRWQRWVAGALLLALLFMILFSWSLFQSFSAALLPVWLILLVRLWLFLSRRGR